MRAWGISPPRQVLVQIRPDGELPQHFLIDTRLVVEPLAVGDRGELEQVGVSGEVLGEQEQMKRAFLPFDLLFFPPVAGGHVGFHANDRLDARFDGGLIKLHRPEQVAMIGDGHRARALDLGRLDQRLDPRRAVKQTVMRMNVKMCEPGSIRHEASAPSYLKAIIEGRSKVRQVDPGRIGENFVTCRLFTTAAEGR